jgi:hypothetical protein
MKRVFSFLFLFVALGAVIFACVPHLIGWRT